MKQSLLLLTFALLIFPKVYSQSAGEIYSLALGQQKCLFKYSSKSKSLILLDTTSHEIAIKYGPRDTVFATDPSTGKTEAKFIVNDGIKYHVEASMTYNELLDFLKTGFTLKGNAGDLKVSSYNIYYESATDGDILPVKYPETSEVIIAKIHSLSRGGFVLLHPKAADQDRVGMYAGGVFLALIRIK